MSDVPKLDLSDVPFDRADLLKDYVHNVEITEELVRNFCKIIQDDNPLHFGDEEGNVMPGALMISLLYSNPVPGFFIRNFKIKFLAPIHFPTTVRVYRKVWKATDRKAGELGDGIFAIKDLSDGIIKAKGSGQVFRPTKRLMETFEQGVDRNFFKQADPNFERKHWVNPEGKEIK